MSLPGTASPVPQHPSYRLGGSLALSFINPLATFLYFQWQKVTTTLQAQTLSCIDPCTSISSTASTARDL